MEILWKHPGHPMTRINQQDGVTFLSFPLLEKTGVVVCGFSTRLGGVSRGCCESMNLSFTRGDDPEAVMENYRRIGHALGISPEQIVCSDQTHTVNVRKVGRDDCGNGITKPKPYRDVDGLITDEAQVALATFYADCVPLYLVDPEKKAIGLAHSGWRGTVGKIGKATVVMWLQYPFREYRFTKMPLTSRTLLAVETDRRIC